jgi:hypothetical protein
MFGRHVAVPVLRITKFKVVWKSRNYGIWNFPKCTKNPKMDLNQDQDLGLKRLRSGLVFGLDSGSIPGFKIKRLGSGSGFGLGLGHFRVFSAFRQIPEVQQIPDFPTHQNISQEGVRKTGGVWTIDK